MNELSHLVGSSTRVKSPCISFSQSLWQFSNIKDNQYIKFSQSKITLHTVQQKPFTVQQDSRQPIDISARVNINHPAYSSARACDSSAMFKTTNRQFSQSTITLASHCQHFSWSLSQFSKIQDKRQTVQQGSRQPINSLARVKSPCLQFSQTVQQDLRQPIDSSARVK